MSTPMNDDFGTDDIVEAEHIQQVFAPLGDLEEGQAFFREDIGVADAYKVDFSGSGANKNEIAAYKDGQMIVFKAAAANTGAATLQVVGPAGDLSAKPIVKNGNVALAAGDVQAGQMIAVVYNQEGSGRFEMTGNPSGPASLSDLSDVTLSSPSANQLLAYTGSAWENRSPQVIAGSWTRSAAHTATGGTWTALAWDVARVANSAIHSTSTNNTRFYAPVSGIYSLDVSAYVVPPVSGDNTIRFVVTLNTNAPSHTTNLLYSAKAQTTGYYTIDLTGIIEMAAGDYFQVWARPNNTQTLPGYTADGVNGYVSNCSVVYLGEKA